MRKRNSPNNLVLAIIAATSCDHGCREHISPGYGDVKAFDGNTNKSQLGIVAAMEVFRDLSATRSAVVDPYPLDLNAKMMSYLKDWGFEVASLVNLGTSFTESSITSIADIYRAAKRAIRETPQAQAAFIPCANFPVVDVIEDIETDFRGCSRQ